MAPAELRVEVVYCPQPGACEQVSLVLPQGARLDQALQASGLCQRHGLAPEEVVAGLWSRKAAGDTELRDQDRVEIYRPLKVDPKEARRARYRGQRPKPGSRSPD